MKKIAILGSTGSIGTQTLDVARANADLQILRNQCAGQNVKQLERTGAGIRAEACSYVEMRRLQEDLAVRHC